MSNAPAPPDPRDLIEREPPGWGMLPVAVAAVIAVIALIVWLTLRFDR